MKYADFLDSKRILLKPSGFDVKTEDLNPAMFDWQKAITRWAIARGRAALFEDCGMGKTLQELEWGHQVCKHTNGAVLLLTPLAVAEQTVCIEAPKFGYQDVHLVKCDGDVKPGINVTNYQKLHKFKPERFDGLIGDEASILKNEDGATRKEMTEFAKLINYRLAGTATPAPNDLIELANQAEFLDIMSVKEIIAMFFKQDGNSSHEWRLKGHAEQPFWKFVAEWSVAVRKPSDLGYDDGDFILPPLNVQPVVIESQATNGFLFPMEASTLQERRQARRESLNPRVDALVRLVKQTHEGSVVNKEPWVIWCGLNDEQDALEDAFGDDVFSVHGHLDDDEKTRRLMGWIKGERPILVSKPQVAGFGINAQRACKVAFVGLSDSWEQYYQAVRRCWRFGQKNQVDCYVITATTEGAVVANIKRKEKQASEMFDEIVKHMNVHELSKVAVRSVSDYKEGIEEGEGWKLMLGDSCERIKEVADNSIGLSVYSVPFPGMYAYNNTPRDIGNSSDMLELIKHWSFMLPDLLRITMPGRLTCCHLTQMPVFKGKDGHIGLRDFRGETIKAFTDAGWEHFSEITIDKNPMLKASRSKESTLLFKTLSKDSCGCRPALADYIVIFRKPGDNPEPVDAGTHERWNPDGGWISSDEWCEWAAPVWYRAMPKDKSEHQPFQANYPSRNQATDGILETDVLGNKKQAPNTSGVENARDEKDEKHLCPLQLGVIERCIKLWSNPGNTIFSPFAGIGSEGYQAIMFNRKFVGIELKPSYFREAVHNLKMAVKKKQEIILL